MNARYVKSANSMRTPTEMRNMFGANLRQLADSYPSISELSRRLGINRTQLNRYISGESFPRPDVLDKICRFFGVDARILLEPVEQIGTKNCIINGPVLSEFLGTGATNVGEGDFPSGFYRFSRKSFVDDNKFVIGLAWVFRDEEGVTYLKGHEIPAAMRYQGLSTSMRYREFRGLVTRHEDGVAFSVSRRRSITYSFNYLARVASLENNFWVGYVTRTIREGAGERITRMVYEHLGTSFRAGLSTARTTGFSDEEDLPPFHRRLLQPHTPFT